MSHKAKVLVLTVLVVAGCASRPINEPITQVDPKSGYRPYLLIPKRQNNDPHTLFVLAFSGGGTRAAAFSYGVLEELRRTEIVDRRPAPPADRRGRSHHRRVGGELHGARVRALRRAAVLRVRAAVPQARRAGRPGLARPEPVQLVEVHRRQRRALGARRGVLRRDPVRRRDLRRPARQAGAGRDRHRDRHLDRARGSRSTRRTSTCCART